VKNERQIAPHPATIPIHDVEIRADMRREIDLMITRRSDLVIPAHLTRDLITGCHIDDVDHCVHKFRAECRSQIVTAALDEHQLDIGMALEQIIQGRLIMRGIFTDRRVRATSGFDAQNAVLRQRSPACEKLGILLGKMSFVTTAKLTRSRRRRQSASTSAVFPDPTGPPTPITGTCQPALP